MEEEAEGVGTNEREKADASVLVGKNAGSGACKRADESHDSKEWAALGERLEEHQQNAEAAPEQLGQDPVEIVGAGSGDRHLAVARPFCSRFGLNTNTQIRRAWHPQRAFLVLGTVHLFADGIGSFGGTVG